MKKLAFLVLFAAMALIGYSQDKSTRKSPPAKATAALEGTTVTIDYSQPGVKGREIWGKLVPYSKVWRAGANETTTIEFSSDVKVNEMDVPAGKYGLYVIPNENTWTIIISPNIGWGAGSYNAEEDVLRFDTRVLKTDELTERLTYSISEDGEVSINWEYIEVNFTIK